MSIKYFTDMTGKKVPYKYVELIERMKKALRRHGFREDRYGNMVSKDGKVRIKFKKLKWREEHAIVVGGKKQWVGRLSVPYHRTDVRDDKIIVKRR